MAMIRQTLGIQVRSLSHTFDNLPGLPAKQPSASPHGAVASACPSFHNAIRGVSLLRRIREHACGTSRISQLGVGEQAASHGSDLAIVDSPRSAEDGHHPTTLSSRRATTYRQLWDDVISFACRAQAHPRLQQNLLEPLPGGVPKPVHVAFLCQPGTDYVTTLLGLWRLGVTAVPLCPSHPAAEWAYVLTDARCKAVIAEESFKGELRSVVERLDIAYVGFEDVCPTPSTEAGAGAGAGACREEGLPALGALEASRPAYVVYTSGTTGKPKGAVHTHSAVEAQVRDLVEAWAWQRTDRILHFLPLHHLHGILNKLLCPLWAGATVEFLPFHPLAVWRRLLAVAAGAPAVSVVMAVPTIWAQLVAAQHEELSAAEREQCRRACAAVRLMVSGSAALPTSVLAEWEAVSGHVLLERYGMTEFGMGLSSALEVDQRRPGLVGRPLRSVQARICHPARTPPLDLPPGTPGELRVKGPGMFQEYYNRPEETAAAFDEDGYFRTGDVAVFHPDEEAFQILGRASVDIIKTGGYKVSALEVERHLLDHPRIAEVAVVGVEDPAWGQKVAAVVRLKYPDTASVANGETEIDMDIDTLTGWAKERLAVYKIPKSLLIVDEIEKNALGKVNKKELSRKYFANM